MKPHFQDVLSLGWSFIRVVSHQGGLSSGALSSGWAFIRWSLNRVVSHQVVSQQGGLPSSGLIRVVSHQVVFHQWSFIRWSFTRWSSIGGSLSPKWSRSSKSSVKRRMLIGEGFLDMTTSYSGGRFQKKSALKGGVIHHQGLFHKGCLSPGWTFHLISGSLSPSCSLIRWSLRVVFRQVVSYQMFCHQGGLSSSGLP